MTYQAPFPTDVSRLEYIKLYFYLELLEEVELPPLALLRLRRELLGALKIYAASASESAVSILAQLLEPDLASDPETVRQVQKPSAALILSPAADIAGRLPVGKKILLPVLFLGQGLTAYPYFLELLDCLGPQGLFKGQGRFVVEAIESEDASGLPAMLWLKGEPRQELTPPVSDLGWWLERQVPMEEPVTLEFVTPARLIHQGKPMFKAAFSEVFPFILRRVSQVLHQHLGRELIKEPTYLLDQAAQVEVIANELAWRDWRTLDQQDSRQQLGGLLGSLRLSGDAIGELLWILQLGSLLNVGKGAAYGAGQFRLISA